jgi:GH25 family lysozyme M1 (1,4-beta-N-acetylmuramidase)
MSRARHRSFHGVHVASRARVGITAWAAVTVGALGASCLWVVGGSPQATPVRASSLSASSPAASSPLPAASPAEGHSPRLVHDLSGPLAGTGKARPGSAVHMSTAMQQATATAGSTMLNGVDVASFQHPNGAAINWADVAAAGYQFAAIKATEGTYYSNPYYVGDAQAATAAGMYVGAYHFANPHDSTGTAQADYAALNAGKAQNATNANYKVGGQYLPLMLDLEYNPYPADGNECYGLSPAQMVSWISNFMTEATTRTGAAPIIYTPRDWWDTCTGNSTAFGGDLLWVPAYSAGTPGTLPAGWNTWTMWQYTSSGSVPGISGAVDLDYFSGGPQVKQTVVNTPASVQIETLNALAGQKVTYSASGLPPGMTMSSAGLITGTATATGAYQVTVTASSSSAVLPGTVSFTWDVDQPPAFTSAGQVTFHAGVAGSFTVTATGVPAPTFAETGTLPAGVSFTSAGVLSGTPAATTAGSYPIQITASNVVGSVTQAFTLTVNGGSSFVAAGPVRVLDTRNGTGGYSAPVGPGGTISLRVTGVHGVPSSGVTAVVLNVTATGPTASSVVTVYPDGKARPGASNLNFTPGETIPNLVVVPVGADGKVDFYNAKGSVNLVADLAGYYVN